MGRGNEFTVGETAEVWVQDRGGGARRSRGTIVIEDLTMVLDRIAVRTGANGPQSPVTQYILAEAARHLAAQLEADARPRAGREPVPRFLSSALGHQPFIESVLGMSQHQMLRRWPLATDWYNDVVSYILRPDRFADREDDAIQVFAQLHDAPLGEVLAKFCNEHLTMRHDSALFRLATTIQVMWPDCPPVRRARELEQVVLEQKWLPIFDRLMGHFRLTPLPGVTLSDISWAFYAFHVREALELGSPDTHPTGDDSGWTRTARSALMLATGLLADERGHVLTMQELIDRRPAAS